ncbi:MAG: 2-amino-4-hydroxy-6-hydroxymethyldihydropteridine diphosphokinase [Candidatus Cybelea sp.]
MTHSAFIGIGSNLGDRFANVERAFASLGELGRVVRRSSLYWTAPWGNADQPWFLNAVALVETDLTPRLLLERLLAIEREGGRIRRERWGPRAIDLDLLIFDDLEIDEAGLRVPHAHLRERAFVLVPLAEIDDRFAALRDALRPAELAGVARAERESVDVMPQEQSLVSERVRALARFLAESDAVAVRVEDAAGEIELVAAPKSIRTPDRATEPRSAEVASQRIDTIKADLVGIFRLTRPVPAEGDALDGDRELGYIEALGIRTPIHSLGAGRLVSVATADGMPVEYGQALFLVARGK